MKFKVFLLISFIAVSSAASAQSKTTEALEKKHSDALKLFFYQNTLRMLNQKNDPNFDELIKDIEKKAEAISLVIRTS
jgi:sulfur relay (sulfurtransferase) complex TusBCD TusD component (DsrE family)